MKHRHKAATGNESEEAWLLDENLGASPLHGVPHASRVHGGAQHGETSSGAFDMGTLADALATIDKSVHRKFFWTKLQKVVMYH